MAVFAIESFCLSGFFSSGAGTWDGYFDSSHCCQSTLGGVDSSANKAKLISGAAFIDIGFCQWALATGPRVSRGLVTEVVHYSGRLVAAGRGHLIERSGRRFGVLQ